ncbi:SMP-30/gluconolactonase/LRE family protein [Dyadobacter chenhuakuii]|uniref:SMP-30/gluconolactonase/LRE family protein n=1 Tax=Dyadobacter chenhuakuii TaxID=2909339 RepID=A0ABY4XST0_9BACT|nr:SMP-30/gluconolactonase/LRE family protein [Dyadobacter chenhuakuii]MCF2492533.1 SMP-30/gluconolactonase/LRE family protein [Dyadobacter chenhuakuii]USJ33170.1 SMP-30/gluconolactonase/LRE family protein [Dyadobacter chenhuakuii]
MHIVRTFAFVFCISINTLFAQAPTENYPVDPASEEQVGVPKGEVLKFTFEHSKFFPGTWREYWVYVPAQYKPDKPACVYINQDGIQWKAPVVFDNLIHKGEMPVTIGVFVMHGKVKAANASEANDRFNRSFEYDGLGDAYARFILEEILPQVEKQKTSDGRVIHLSKNGNDRAIGGSSSGAVCAFTAAWERPDAFTRVYSAIGTYVGLRGADRYHTLVRKYEPKPIRIFLQDGANDLNIYAGDWWMANQTMLRALTFAGYEVQHQWGEGGHNGKHGTALFPEAMRFLWKDWPKPVKAGNSQNQMLSAILIPGQDWELTSEEKKEPNKKQKITKNLSKSDSIVAHNGNVYVTISDGPEKSGSISLITRNGKKVLVDKGLLSVGGIALSPDQTLLYATESASHWVWAYQIQPDGKLTHKQKYGWLHVRDDDDNAGARGVTCDREGRIYVASRMGIQVLDQTGRVNAILPTPAGAASRITFGGENFDTIYATAGEKVYRRKLNVKGANSRDTPNKPDAPKL